MDDYSSPWAYRAKWVYTLAVVVALLLPVFYTIYISFNEHGFGAQTYEFTWDWYVVLLGNDQILDSLRWTLLLGAAAVLAAVPMGLVAAKHYKSTRHKVLFVTLMLCPLFVPADILGSSLLVYFKNLNRAFESFGESLGVGWFSGWFELGFTTALIGQILWTVPYAFIVILITMSRYHRQQTEAARACGATAWQAFWRVEFPQIRVGIFSASAFVFILSFNEYTRTNLLKGGFDTFTTVLISHMYSTGMSEDSYAMAGLVSVISMTVIGSVLIYSLAKAERLEREARAKTAPLMSR
ncbi:MAG: ABC transporter permease [Candidatus Methylomirabilia bacterium]